MDAETIGLISGLGASVVGWVFSYGRLSMKVDILWRYFEKFLDSRHSDLFTSSSARKLTPKGEEYLSGELREALNNLAHTRLPIPAILAKVMDMVSDEPTYVAARIFIEQLREQSNTQKSSRIKQFFVRK